MALLLEHKRQLAGGGGLAGPLETHQHNHRHARRGQGDFALGAPQKLRQLIPDDFDDRLVRLQAAEDLLTHGLLTDMGNEILSHLEIDIRLQKRPSDLAEGPVDITLRKLPFSPQILKRRLQLVS